MAIITKNLVVWNTRTEGQQPNLLCAQYDTKGDFIPLLQVEATFPVGLPYSKWNLTQDHPGDLYHLEMADKNGAFFRLCVSRNKPANGTPCSLQPLSSLPSANWFDSWIFPYSTRLLTGFDLGIQPTDSCLSLDAGKYPQPVVWAFSSSVNQTWQYQMNGAGPMQGRPFF